MANLRNLPKPQKNKKKVKNPLDKIKNLCYNKNVNKGKVNPLNKK